MSEIYYPQMLSNPDGMTQADLANWVFEELNVIAQAMNSDLEVREFIPLIAPPVKYSEGSVVMFATEAATNVFEFTGPGLYIYREGQWRRLVEET